MPISAADVPLVVLLTKIDLVCSHVNEDLKNTFKSEKISQIVKEVAMKLQQLPENHIFPIKNYEAETRLKVANNILVLEALRQMLWFCQDHLEPALATPIS